jgi:cytochrome c biogenesis protein CcdA
MLVIDKLQLREPRTQVGLLASMLAVAAAVVAALVAGPGATGIVGNVERASSASGTLLQKVSGALPLGYAFAAGMVASVNPCGFALLPAYLGYYLSDGGTGAGQRRAGQGLARAVEVSAMVTIGFVLLFGVVGLVLNTVTFAAVSLFPWIGLLIGVFLVGLGGRLAGGAKLYSPLGERVAGRLGRGARQTGARGYLLYGLAYGAASLGCTLPIFLLVVAGSLTRGGLLSGALQFVLYALGMGTVITALTLATAFLGRAAVSRVRAVARYVQPVSAALLLLVGAYTIYYWLTVGQLLDRLGLS